MVRLSPFLTAALTALSTTSHVEAKRVARPPGGVVSSRDTVDGRSTTAIPAKPEPVILKPLHNHHIARADTHAAAPAPEPVVLRPLRMHSKSNAKRALLKDVLKLKSKETLYWSSTHGTVAKLDWEAPGDAENIVNLEDIDDMVRQVACPSKSEDPLKVTFAEEADYNDAEDIWKWVNQKEENQFFLLVGAGKCGWNTDRIVYKVTGLVYNDEAETAYLHATQIPWSQAAHTYDLTLGNTKIPHSQQIHRARAPGFWDDVGDFFENVGDKIEEGIEHIGDKIEEAIGQFDTSPSLSIPLGSNLTGKALSFSVPGAAPGGGDISLAASCITCTTSGSIWVQAHFAAKKFQMTDAALEISLPDPIVADVVLGVTLSAALTQPLTRTIPVFAPPLGGVKIPGVISLGPQVTLSLGAEIGAVRGSVGVTMGGRASINKDSKARLDFLDEKRTGKTGWDVNFDNEQFKVDTSVEVGAAGFVRGAIGVEVSVFESGFLAEVSADAPKLSATLKATASTNCTVCGQYMTGVTGSLNFGTTVGVGLKKKVAGAEQPLWGVNFVEAKMPAIASFCQGFGPKGQDCKAKALIP
ncbi:hypothetical protein N656DRAFT_799594 [Canariomyces notabilis]|uniref:Uncharacterized protein n=1 Tax=Canariomyces notabilis TaxID=2074819 RepID=A0AAN6QR55_9PEZI|nr:hypothetical protein N656DRAFT_799594 [Canariomyces arenarius]